MDDQAHIPIEELLRHSGWLRRLARELTFDAATADDVYQETMLGALRSPPRRDAGLRGWLATVARNALRQIRRSEKARATREKAVAEPEARPDPRVAAERLVLQRCVARAVLELPEPGRSAVLLRYYEGLSAVEIARQLGANPSTVRTRLADSLARLRRRLDAEYGDRRGRWTALLLPLVTPRSAGALAKALAMSLKTKIALSTAAALALVAAGVFVLRPPGDDPLRAPAPDSTTARETPAADAGEKPREVETRTTTWREPSGRDIAGGVRDAKGAALPGAVVRALAVGDVPVEETEIARFVVDGEGRFVLGPFEGEVVLEASAPGHATERRLAEPGDRQDFALETANRLAGRVVDGETGAAVGKAVVNLEADHRYAGWSPAAVRNRTTRSAADGSFAFEGVRAGFYHVTAHPSNAPPAIRRDLRIGAEGVEGLVLEVPPGVLLRGRVHDAATGAPVAEVAVRLRGAPRLSAVSGEDGRFEIAGFPRGNLLSAHGYGMQALVLALPNGAPYIEPVEPHWPVVYPDPGGDGLECDVALRPAATVTGVVLGPDGRPAAGARVGFDPYNVIREPNHTTAMTGPDGTFRLTGESSGDRQIYAVKEGFAVGEGTPVRLRAGEVVEGAVVWLGPLGGRVSGVVVDEAGQPIQGASVGYRREGMPNGRYGNWTDSAGRFSLSGIPPGTGTLVVSAPGHLSSVVRNVSVFSGETTEDVRAVLLAEAETARRSGEEPSARTDPARQGEIRGRVVRADGETPGWIEVWCLPPREDAPGFRHWSGNGAGEFALSGLPDGRYRVEAAAGSGLFSEPEVVEIEDGRTIDGLRLVLREGGTLLGTLFTLQGRPASDTKVFTRPLGGRPDEEKAWRTGLDGGIRIGPIAPGSYRVTAARGPASASIQVEIVAGEKIRRNLRLDAGRTLCALVLGPDGSPVKGVEIVLRDGDGEPVRIDGPVVRHAFEMRRRYDPDATFSDYELSRRRTGWDGHAVIHPLPPGRYSVSVEGRHVAGGEATVVVAEETAAHLELRLE